MRKNRASNEILQWLDMATDHELNCLIKLSPDRPGGYSYDAHCMLIFWGLIAQEAMVIRNKNN